MIKRTSLSHPLQIATIRAGDGLGFVGISFCPGKKDNQAMTGAWDRDLGVDLDAIASWNAATVVTLLERDEFDLLKVRELGYEVDRRHMTWRHHPIPDVSAPDRNFDKMWPTLSADLLHLLQNGANVFVHCRGGLGRAGTIAARLLVEAGWTPDAAIAEVRAVRPGAIETHAQAQWVQAGPSHGSRTAKTNFARDRALGAFLGLAIGDALGTTLEFSQKPQFKILHDVLGGGPFELKPGQWTDDTAMALALADSLLHNPTLDAKDLMGRFVAWRDTGSYSCTGKCFDIGVTISSALRRWENTGNPLAGSMSRLTAGNGALMRIAPVAIRHFRNREMLISVAARQTRTTHGAKEAIDASLFFCGLLADAIEGQPLTNLLEPHTGAYCPKVAKLAADSWRGRHRDSISSTGYVVHSLEAALWAIGRTTDFRSAVLLAANLGGDADTTAAITGQLAGAIYGASGIPEDWLSKLAWRARITNKAEALFVAGELP